MEHWHDAADVARHGGRRSQGGVSPAMSGLESFARRAGSPTTSQFALNVILITASERWPLRYPNAQELSVLKRAVGAPAGQRQLAHASARGSTRVRAGDLASRPAVVVASERD
jgi:hypothetical protein